MAQSNCKVRSFFFNILRLTLVEAQPLRVRSLYKAGKIFLGYIYIYI